MFVKNGMESINEAKWQINVGEDNRSQKVRIVEGVWVDIDLVGDRSSGIHD